MKSRSLVRSAFDRIANPKLRPGARKDILCARWYRIIAVTGNVIACGLVIVGLAGTDDVGGRHVGSPAIVACLAFAASMMSVLWTTDGILRREISGVMQGTAVLFLGYSMTGPREGLARPGWLTAMAVGLLVFGVFVAFPLLLWFWRRVSDERERAIFGAATSVAFGVVVVLAAALAALKDVRFSAFELPTLTPTIVLVAAIGSWMVSMFVLRRRM